MTDTNATAIVEVPSSTTPDTFYVVSRRGDAVACTCPGFSFRGTCKHLVFAPSRHDVEQAANPLPCAGCRNFHLTDADRLKAHPDVLSPTKVANILSREVANIDRKPKPVVIPAGHCWVGSCEGFCKGHSLPTPQGRLARPA